MKKALIYLPLLAALGTIGVWLYSVGGTIAVLKEYNIVMDDKVVTLEEAVKEKCASLKEALTYINSNGTFKFNEWQLEFVGMQKDVQSIQTRQAEIQVEIEKLNEKIDTNQQQILEAIRETRHE